VLVAILKGGAEKLAEAGAVLVGGHTVEDDEPKYGMAVTGLVDPARLVSTVGARPGDRLVLTKPLGTGILATALKGEVINEAQMAEAILGMETLNRAASEAMLEVGVHACTDITGFGLLGHSLEMAEASGVGLVIETAACTSTRWSWKWRQWAWSRPVATTTANTTCLTSSTATGCHRNWSTSSPIRRLPAVC